MAALGLAVSLAILAQSFAFGLDLSDEGLYVYLLSHPDTAFASMDHFLWGHALALFDWTVIEARWLTLFALLASNVLLIAGAVFLLARFRPFGGDTPFVLSFAAALSLMGALLYFSFGRATLGYNATASMSANLFAAALFVFIAARRKALRTGAMLLMGAANALAFAARAPGAIMLPLMFALAVLLLQRGSFRRRDIVFAIIAITGATMAIIALCALAGYDVGAQLLFLSQAAKGTHDPLPLLAADARYGAFLAALALAAAAAVVLIHPRPYRLDRLTGAIIIAGLSAAVPVVLAVLAWQGSFTMLPAHGDLANLNPPQPIAVFMPPIHIGMMTLLILRALPLAAAYRPQWQRRIAPDTDPAGTTRLLLLAVLLYGVCLVQGLGSDNGVWTKSLRNIGPLFLALGLLLGDGVPRRWLAPWMPAAIVALVGAFVGAILYVNGVAQPYRLDGGAAGQTAILDHPAHLRGLRVSPSIAALQDSIEAQLRAAGFNARREPILPGGHLIGTAVLADARALGLPLSNAQNANAESLNCTALRAGLAVRPPRIAAIDLRTLGAAPLSCLSAYEAGPPLSERASGAVTLLARRH